MSPSDDERNRRLVERIQAGKEGEESFHELYEQNRVQVERFFRHAGRRVPLAKEDCRDLTQEVFIRVYKSIGSFRGQSSFATWLHTIAVNLLKNEIRKRRTLKRDKVEKSYDELLESDPEALRDRSTELSAAPTQLDGLIEQEREAAIQTVVDAMPEQMRRCFKLRYQQGFKSKDIATLMKISDPAVRTHLHQARKRLQQELGLDVGEDEEAPL